MFLTNYETNEMVLDFQLVYDTDSRMHLDFYADGMCIESKVVAEKKNIFTKVSYGLIKANKDEFDQYEKEFQIFINDPKTIEELSLKMINSIIDVHKSCMAVEKELKGDIINKDSWESLYRTIITMMAYRRVTEGYRLVNFISEKNSCKNRYMNIRVPSHVTKLENAIKRLNKNGDIDKFVKEYGFLSNFNIEEGALENIENITELLSNYTESKKKRIHSMTVNTGSDLGLRLYRRFGWYEELRHYYQLRALRNFRHIFRKLDMDIYISDYSKLEETLVIGVG